jgi:thioredoxin
MADVMIIRCHSCGAGNRVRADSLHLEPVCGRCKNRLPPPWTRPISIRDGNFQEEVLQCPIPVLVDFWSPRCAPCAQVAPILDQLAAELAGQLKICKITIDDNVASATRFSVYAVPTMLLFRRGILLDTLAGAMSGNAIRMRISRFLLPRTEN